MQKTGGVMGYNYFQEPAECESLFLTDEAGFSKIVIYYSPLLLNKAMYITRQYQTAEDIVQETFLKLWENRIDIIPANIGGWLYKVACNLAYTYMKRENSKNRIYASLKNTAHEYNTDVEDRLMKKDHKLVFQKIYTRLPEKQKLVYHLAHGEGLSRNEIADQLRISPHTVKNHLARAVQFIKEHVSACALFFLFFVFNNIFFQNGSTKIDLNSLYKTELLFNKKSYSQKAGQRVKNMSTLYIKSLPKKGLLSVI